MTTTEAKFSLTVKIHDQLFTVRGDNYAELEASLADAAANVATVSNGIHVLMGAAPAASLPVQQPVVQPAQPMQPQPMQPQPMYTPQQPVQAQQPAPQYMPQQQAGPTVLFGGQSHTVVDRWGKRWTYNMPGAPALPDGRGAYAWLEATSKSGSPYSCWKDPAKGPESFPAGAAGEAPVIWPDR